MIDRLGELERRLDALEERIRRAEERASTPAGVPPASTEAPAGPIPAIPAGVNLPAIAFPAVLSAIGRTCVVLGGAFLIRAGTESGAVSRRAGVAVGLAYGIGWLMLAFRRRARGNGTSAAFHGVTGIVIAFSVIGEAATRFAVFVPATAIAIAVALSALALAAGWRQKTSVLAWAATIASVALLFSLAPATGRIDAIAAAVIALAAALSGLAYARRWPGPRWIAAGAADIAIVAAAAILTRVGGVPDEYRNVSAPAALALALALPLVFLSIFAMRTIGRRRPVTAFEVVQSIVSLVVGFGAAIPLARVSGFGEASVGVTALATGIGFYGVAFAFLEKRAGLAANFHFYASLGLLTTILGGVLWLGSAALAVLWGTAAVGTAVLGVRFRRSILCAHAAVYLAAATIGSGLAGAMLDAFFVPAGTRWRTFGAGPLAALTSAAASAALFFLFADDQRPVARATRIVAASIAVAGTNAAAIYLLHSLAGAVSPGPAAAAAVRSAVIATSAILLAVSARRRWHDLRWLVYPLLAIGGAKLVLEDLPRGSAATLFAGFVCYGSALFLVPRLLRRET